MTQDTYTVTRTATMDAEPSRIYDQIVDFHKWQGWSPWEDLDPDLRRTYSGAESGPGAVYAWSGNRKAGQGRMEITEASQPSRLAVDVVFEKPFKARNETVFAIEPTGSGSKVTWTMTGRKTAITKVMSIFTSMDKLIGRDFEKGLARLKSAAEKPPTD